MVPIRANSTRTASGKRAWHVAARRLATDSLNGPRTVMAERVKLHTQHIPALVQRVSTAKTSARARHKIAAKDYHNIHVSWILACARRFAQFCDAVLRRGKTCFGSRQLAQPTLLLPVEAAFTSWRMYKPWPGQQRHDAKAVLLARREKPEFASRCASLAAPSELQSETDQHSSLHQDS